VTWTIGGVTLPYAPEKMRFPTGCKKENVDQDTGYSIAVVSGLASEVYLEGALSEAGSTSEDLVDDYVAPLTALVGTEVAVTTTDGLIDGNWLLDSFEPQKDGPIALFKYTMRLTKTSETIVLS